MADNEAGNNNFLTEEVEGLTSCVITLHNLIHMPQDIERFSGPDNGRR